MYLIEIRSVSCLIDCLNVINFLQATHAMSLKLYYRYRSNATVATHTAGKQLFIYRDLTCPVNQSAGMTGVVLWRDSTRSKISTERGRNVVFQVKLGGSV